VPFDCDLYTIDSNARHVVTEFNDRVKELFDISVEIREQFWCALYEWDGLTSLHPFGNVMIRTDAAEKAFQSICYSWDLEFLKLYEEIIHIRKYGGSCLEEAGLL
jgi:hypothetical protein